VDFRPEGKTNDVGPEGLDDLGDNWRNIMPVQHEVKAAVTEWQSLFSAYRIVVIRGDEVTQGVLHSELSAGEPRVRAAIAGWEGTHFLHQTPYGLEVTLVRRIAPGRRERWWLHLLLGLLTLATTTIAGAYLRGGDPLLLASHSLGPWSVPLPGGLILQELLPGLAFSVPLMIILLGHELGHYLVARRHRMDVSPPYFIPAPNWLNLIGTFGAFIRLRSVMINRTMLLDVGAGGPLVSFVLSLPFLVLGLHWSLPIPVEQGGAPAHFAVLFGGAPLWLGDSILVQAVAWLMGMGSGVWALHPFALAGWLGLFVTALNLFPLAQLDGGHILYALLGPAQRRVGQAFLGVLVVLGWWWWGWWFWAAVILLLGRGSIGHPAVFDPRFPVSGVRRQAGWACIAIFVLTFLWRPFPM
jgi:Zn-dependent protease